MADQNTVHGMESIETGPGTLRVGFDDLAVDLTRETSSRPHFLSLPLFMKYQFMFFFC